METPWRASWSAAPKDGASGAKRRTNVGLPAWRDLTHTARDWGANLAAAKCLTDVGSGCPRHDPDSCGLDGPSARLRVGRELGPNPFHNLRARRGETQLAENFSRHVVCVWIGNFGAIAAKPCPPVTDALLTTRLPLDSADRMGKSGTESGAAMARGSSPYLADGKPENKKTRVWRGFSRGYVRWR